MRRLAPALLLFALLAACSQAPAPTTPLRVIGLDPAAGAADVPLDASVTVRFDGDVDDALLHDGVLALQAGTATVDGELAYDHDARTLTFRPDALLQAETTYAVVLSSDVRSADGGELKLSSDWRFTTVPAEPAGPVDDEIADPDPTSPDSEGDGPDGEGEGEGPTDGDDPDETSPDTDGDGIPDDEDPAPNDPDVNRNGIPDGDEVDVDVPGVLSVSPAPWSIAQRGTDVRVRFDEPIDPATLQSGTIRVYSGFLSGLIEVFYLGGPGIDGTLTYDDATHEAVFTPVTPLAADEWHWVVLDLNVADLAGNVLAGEGVWLFATER